MRERSKVKKIKTYIDGDYTVNEYENGTVERYLTGSDVPIEQPNTLSESEEIILDTNAKVTYLECLAELSGGGITCKIMPFATVRKAVAA